MSACLFLCSGISGLADTVRVCFCVNQTRRSCLRATTRQPAPPQNILHATSHSYVTCLWMMSKLCLTAQMPRSYLVGSGQLSPLTASNRHSPMSADHASGAMPACLADMAASMAFESPHAGGWAALGFSSNGRMLDSVAVIASTKAANGIGVFDLGGYSPDAITERPGAVAASGRRLSDTTSSFTIFDVRPPPPHALQRWAPPPHRRPSPRAAHAAQTDCECGRCAGVSSQLLYPCTHVQGPFRTA